MVSLGRFRYNEALYNKDVAAVSCSSMFYRLPATGFQFWLMGKLGHAWVVDGIGAWMDGGVGVVLHAWPSLPVNQIPNPVAGNL